jgi:hypothetical protein
MKKVKTMMMTKIMTNNNIKIKENLIDTKEENILGIRVFTLEGTISHLKRVIDMFLILKKNNSSS